MKKPNINERKDRLKLFKSLLDNHKDNLSKIITEETGKPILFSKAEVAKSISHIDYYLENIDGYL